MLMSKPITNMAVSGGYESFNFTVTPTTTGVKEVTTGDEQLLYRFGMLDFVRDARGKIWKIIRK